MPNKDLVDALPGKGNAGTTGATDAMGDAGSDSAGSSTTAGKGGSSNGGSSSGGSAADLTFGVEAGLFRFRTAINGQAAIAPEQASDTQNAIMDTWSCVKLVAQQQEIRATVTVLGQKPVELPIVGGAADVGVDQKLMQITPGGALAFDIGDWILGDSGTDIQIDDVRVGTSTQRTICDDYNDSL